MIINRNTQPTFLTFYSALATCIHYMYIYIYIYTYIMILWHWLVVFVKFAK